MDGFDTRNLRAGQVYELDAQFGRYLIVADYAVPESGAESADSNKQRRDDERFE